MKNIVQIIVKEARYRLLYFFLLGLSAEFIFGYGNMNSWLMSGSGFILIGILMTEKIDKLLYIATGLTIIIVAALFFLSTRAYIY